MELELSGPITVRDSSGERRRFEGPVTVNVDMERQFDRPIDELASGSSSNVVGNCSSSSSGSELGELGDLGDLTVGELVERVREQERG